MARVAPAGSPPSFIQSPSRCPLGRHLALSSSFLPPELSFPGGVLRSGLTLHPLSSHLAARTGFQNCRHGLPRTAQNSPLLPPAYRLGYTALKRPATLAQRPWPSRLQSSVPESSLARSHLHSAHGHATQQELH